MEEYCGTGMAQGLLSFVCDTLKAEGVTYLDVDCETMNPTALRFWTKSFVPYTYSFARRIDERAKGSLEYLSCYRGADARNQKADLIKL